MLKSNCFLALCAGKRTGVLQVIIAVPQMVVPPQTVQHFEGGVCHITVTSEHPRKGPWLPMLISQCVRDKWKCKSDAARLTLVSGRPSPLWFMESVECIECASREQEPTVDNFAGFNDIQLYRRRRYSSNEHNAVDRCFQPSTRHITSQPFHSEIVLVAWLTPAAICERVRWRGKIPCLLSAELGTDLLLYSADTAEVCSFNWQGDSEKPVQRSVLPPKQTRTNNRRKRQEQCHP